MIKVIHIAPTANMLEVDKRYNKGVNMLLTHLVLGDDDYRNTANKLIGEKYLDNSYFELGYCLKPKKMLEAAELVGATVLICPDGTVDGLEEFKEAGYKVMCIPKTEEQFKDMMYSQLVDLVGLSEEHIAYRHSPGARYEFLRDNIEPMMPRKKIHLLGGTDSIYELGMVRPFEPYIESWDSSAALWQGHLGHYLGNVVCKDTTGVDFNTQVDLDSLLVQQNIAIINLLTGETL